MRLNSGQASLYQRARGTIRRSVKGVLAELCTRAPARDIITWRGTGTDGAVALTFDDGPHPEFTYPILETLERYSVKATFFVVASYAERNPDALEATIGAGHEIGNHTYSHSTKNLPKEIRRAEEVFGQHNVRPSLYRPPYTNISLRDLAWLRWRGYSTVIWSHDTRDSLRADGLATDYPPPERIQAGDIIIMHDDNALCVNELEQLIKCTLDRGLKFVTMSELQ